MAVLQRRAYPMNQILSLCAHKVRHRHLPSGYPSLRHHRRILERGFPNQELVRQDAETPQVHLLVVIILLASRLDHLRRQIVQSPTHSIPPVVWRVHAPPEIRDLDLSMDANQDILRFDIPMHDVLFVQMLQRGRHLRNVLRRLPLWKLPLPP